MKKSLSLLAALGFAIALGSAHAFADGETPPPTADGLLQRVLAEPGQFSQICSISPMNMMVPLPIYRFVTPGEIHVSEANLAALRARRGEILPELKKHLSSTTLTGPLYEIILGLRAVELLPDLLRIENEVAGELSMDAPVSANGALKQAEIALWKTRVRQRDLLSAMLLLLRGQRFPPLLDSVFEKTYAEALRAAVSPKDFRNLKTPADALAQGMDWVRFDPIYHIPIGQMKPPAEVPFTPEVRAQVRALAEQFLATVPPEKWLTTAD